MDRGRQRLDVELHIRAVFVGQIGHEPLFGVNGGGRPASGRRPGRVWRVPGPRWVRSGLPGAGAPSRCRGRRAAVRSRAGRGPAPGIVRAEAVDAAVRVLDEAVRFQDGAGAVADGGGGDAAVGLPGQDETVRLRGLDTAQCVVPDLGEGAVVTDEQVAGDLLGAQERVVRQSDAVGLGDAAVRLVGQGAGATAATRKLSRSSCRSRTTSWAPSGRLRTAACRSGCSAREAATRSRSQMRAASSARSSLASGAGGSWSRCRGVRRRGRRRRRRGAQRCRGRAWCPWAR